MTRRWKVVYLDHVARLSGGELALARLLPAMLGRVDPLVVLAEDGPLVGRLEADGIRVLVVPMSRAARDVRRDDRLGMVRSTVASAAYVATITQLLRRERPDLVHTNSLKAHLYGGVAGRLANVPVLWHVRDRIAPDYLPTPVVRLVHGAARVLPTGVIANSRSTAATLSGVTPSTVLVEAIPSPVQLRPPPCERTPGQALTFAMVGRLAPWKGQDVFLRAFAAAFAGSGMRAVIAGAALFGEDDYAASLPVLARHLGVGEQVRFAGHLDDVSGLLSVSDVAVHCSVLPEPFGQVVVEAMSAGVPIIAADAGGPADIVSDGVDGLLTKPGDIEALASAMRRVHGDVELRQALAHNGLQTAQRYRPDVVADQLALLYERLLHAPSG